MFRVSRERTKLQGRIRLDGSKSISNRVLLLKALSGEDFSIEGLSNSRDSQTMLRLIHQFREGDITTPFDAGAAGTTFRFMTAFLALQEGSQIMTGSDRMKQRPIGPLVDALRQLGAQIDYLGKEGYPPLQLNTPRIELNNRIVIAADTSSQYISALLMVGSFLPDGLELQLLGNVVSRPYIEMTLRIMDYFGLRSGWQEDRISVKAQEFEARSFQVEADWSAASYHYALVALAPEAELYLDGLFTDSFQGDAVLTKMMVAFGIQTEFTDSGIRIHKPGMAPGSGFEWDFLECPDLAQTLAVICGAKGIQGRFTGLRTLRIKETDRIRALQIELAKVEVSLKETERDWFEVTGKASWAEEPIFDTYEDHRMAMAFAPLGMIAPILIQAPEVVAKSYPSFWDDLRSLGFSVEPLS